MVLVKMHALNLLIDSIFLFELEVPYQPVLHSRKHMMLLQVGNQKLLGKKSQGNSVIVNPESVIVNDTVNPVSSDPLAKLLAASQDASHSKCNALGMAGGWCCTCFQGTIGVTGQ